MLLSMIAILAVTFATTRPVKAQPSTTFFVNVDPLMLGWTYLPGINPVYGENIYKDLTSPTVDKVAAGDVRLTPVSDGAGGFYSAGSTVASGDADINVALKGRVAPGWGTVKHRDTGATANLYDFGEFIYKDSGTTVGVVDAGDVRYSNVPGYKVGSTVAAGDTDASPPNTLVAFFPTTSAKYEKYSDNIATNTAYDYARLFVDIMINTQIPDNTPEGIRGWGLKCYVNPDVLTPDGWIGATYGYFLTDYLGRNGSSFTTSIVGTVNPDYLDVSEQILGKVDWGAGNQTTVPEEPFPAEKLITLSFVPQSQIGWSKIDLRENPNGDYQSALTEAWHSATMIDGDYCPPPGPEFPLGLAPIVMAAPLIPIVYLWRIRRRKIR